MSYAYRFFMVTKMDIYDLKSGLSYSSLVSSLKDFGIFLVLNDFYMRFKQLFSLLCSSLILLRAWEICGSIRTFSYFFSLKSS